MMTALNILQHYVALQQFISLFMITRATIWVVQVIEMKQAFSKPSYVPHRFVLAEKKKNETN